MREPVDVGTGALTRCYLFSALGLCDAGEQSVTDNKTRPMDVDY